MPSLICSTVFKSTVYYKYSHILCEHGSNVGTVIYCSDKKCKRPVVIHSRSVIDNNAFDAPRSGRAAFACRPPEIVLEERKQHFRFGQVPELVLSVGPYLGEPVRPVAGASRDDKLGLADCHGPRLVYLVAVDFD